MENAEKLLREREKIMKDFFEAKAKLEEVIHENKSLKAANEQLEEKLHEREEAMQNLFSFVHTGV